MMKNHRIIPVVLIVTIFAGMYWAVILTLVETWTRPFFYNDIPDLIIFIIAAVLFVKARSMENRAAGKFIYIGAAIVAIQRLARIPMQEIEYTGTNLPTLLWTVVWSLYFIGVLFILIGIKKRYD